jgi:hypothetical protein
MGKRKVSIVSILALIVGLSGLGLGAYSLYNYQQFVNQVEPPKPLARASLAFSYSIPSTTWTTINFDVLDYDETGDFNIITNRFICPTSGYYLVSGMVTLIMQDGETILLAAFREGVYEAGSLAHASHSDSVSTGFTDIVYLNVSDYLELRAYHTGSGSRSIFGNAEGTYTYFTIVATDILNL